MAGTGTDVVVVGGGIGGLAAATLIARRAGAGRRVTLFERASTLGGRAASHRREGPGGAFVLNQGPHALYRGGMRILGDLGVEPKGALSLAAGSFAIRGGERYVFPVGGMSLLTTGLLGASEKLEGARLLATVQKIEVAPIMRTTVADWLEAHVRHPRVRELVAALLRLSTYTEAPQHASAGAALAQLQLALDKSVLYLDGGWQSLVDALRARAIEAGVEIVTGRRVVSIGLDAPAGGGARRVRAVHLAPRTPNAGESGESSEASEASPADGVNHDTASVRASSVVLAVGPAAARTILGDAVDPALLGLPARGDGPEHGRPIAPVRAACLDLALSSLPQPRARFALGIDQPLYFSVHSQWARLAPPGGTVIHVAKYLRPDGALRSTESAESELEALVDLLQPGWRDVVVERRFLPSMIVSNARVDAAMGGTAGRPASAVAGVDGVHLVGDWVGPRGMLVDAALASAEDAACDVLEGGVASARGAGASAAAYQQRSP